MNKTSDKPEVPVYFVGAGPGDPELITVKGRRLLSEADIVVYAGSLVNDELLSCCREDAEVYNSASMVLSEFTEIMIEGARAGKLVVRLQTGDPTFYSALGEQSFALSEANVPYRVVPGVSSAFASAAALGKELTMPELTQTIIFTRIAGKTPVPESERLSRLAAHGTTLCIFLSVSMMEDVVRELTEGGLASTTPAAVVRRASWKDELVIRGTLADIADRVREASITKQAMIIVSKTLGDEAIDAARSKLYDKDFTHGCREKC